MEISERLRHESAGKVCLDWEHRFSPVYSLHFSMASLGSVCFLLPVAFHLCESFHDIARAVMFSVELEFPMRIVLTAVDVMYLLYWFILFIYVHFECFFSGSFLRENDDIIMSKHFNRSDIFFLNLG